jgi:subtilisin family serine protease
MRATPLILLALVAYVIADVAPLLNANTDSIINGAYIVVLKDGLDVAARDAHILALQQLITSTGVKDLEIGFRYQIGSFVGFSARLNDVLLKIELAHPDVKYIECDQTVSLVDPIHLPIASNAVITQTGATWGLDRIDQRKLPLNKKYIYNSVAGTGVDAFVLDTGILTTHVDFGGRAQFAFSAIANEANTDLNGHGTHVAGTIGGKTYGVAKNVTLYAVKVLGASGSGTWAGVISGVQFVTNNRTKTNKAVVNMSIGGPNTVALVAAINASVASGVVYVVAAGNNDANACNLSPANAPTAIAVGATTSTDSRASFSNYGACVGLFAPGESITSDYIGSNTATSILSGTSMASPHVAGAIALHLSLDPTLDPAGAKSWVISTATPNVVTKRGSNSPNLLLFSPRS